MNKTKRARKRLQLAKNTVKELSSSVLEGIAGGDGVAPKESDPRRPTADDTCFC